MDLSALFDKVASALLGRGNAGGDDAQEKQLVADMTELVVETVDPRLRLQSGYANKLEYGVRKTIAHLREVGRQPLAPLLLSRAGWSEDPRLNAFFATPDEVTALLGRSKALRALFDDPAHRALGEAYALLAMKKQERNVIAPMQEDDRVLHEVAQVTVGFSGHRLLAPSATLAQTRLEVGGSLILRLAQLVLKRIVDLDMKAADLGERKAWLAARLRLVKLALDGGVGLLEDTAATRSQVAALERELKDTVRDYIETRASVATLASTTGHLKAVLEHPEQYVGLRSTPMRLSRMGVRVGEDFSSPVNAFTLTELTVGDGLDVAIVIVRCPLAELPAEVDPLANAERWL